MINEEIRSPWIGTIPFSEWLGIHPQTVRAVRKLKNSPWHQGFHYRQTGVTGRGPMQWNRELGAWSGFPGRTAHSGTQNRGPNMYDNWDKDLRMLDETSIVQFLKNVYYVLLTRANAEIFVYFMHDETREYFESWL